MASQADSCYPQEFQLKSRTLEKLLPNTCEVQWDMSSVNVQSKPYLARITCASNVAVTTP